MLSIRFPSGKLLTDLDTSNTGKIATKRNLKDSCAALRSSINSFTVPFPIIGNTQTNAIKLSTTSSHNDDGLIDLLNTTGVGIHQTVSGSATGSTISITDAATGVQYENSGSQPTITINGSSNNQSLYVESGTNTEIIKVNG